MIAVEIADLKRPKSELCVKIGHRAVVCCTPSEMEFLHDNFIVLLKPISFFLFSF